MKKLKDILLAINSVIKVEDLATIAGASDLSDEDIIKQSLPLITEGLGTLMTLEAAKNNPILKTHFKDELAPVHKKAYLGGVDEHLLSGVGEIFGSEKLEQLKLIEDTRERTKFVMGLMSDLKKTKKPGNETELEKTVSNLKAQLDTAQKSHQKDLKAKEDEIVKLGNTHNQTLVRSEFNRLANGYKLAPAYTKEEDKIEDLIRERIYKDLNDGATLKLNSGNITLFNKDDPNMELYEGSKRIEIKDKLDSMFAPYLDKNPDPHEKTKFNTQTPQVNQTKVSSLAQDIRDRNKKHGIGVNP